MDNFLLMVVSPGVYAGLMLWADQSGGGRRLWRAWGLSALLLAFGGYLAWYVSYARTGYIETAGVLPIVLAVLPTLAAAATVQAGVRAGWPPGRRWLLAAVAAAMALFPSAFLGHYILPGFLPGSLGCCPL